MKFKPPKGTRDLLEKDAEKMKRIQEIVSKIFEIYGFGPMFTPSIENYNLLSSKNVGDSIKDDIYYFKDKSNREIGLHFDLTIPLARIIASNPSIPKPFKRYSIDKVWRYDNPQSMRWREFWQADIDIIGSNSILSEAELISVICKCLDELGINDYYIRLNNRKYLDKIIGKCVDYNKIKNVYRIIDKLDKIGKDKVISELSKIKCDKKEIIELLDGIKIEDGDISLLINYLEYFGYSDKIKIDTSLVRGLDYYTGLIFEVSIDGKISCGGGGRYDNLISDIGGDNVSGVGISLGLDRILEILNKNGIQLNSKDKFLIVNVDENSKKESIKIVQKLRNSGLHCQFNLNNKSLSNQLEYANSQNIRYVLIIGDKEIKMKRFQLRDMKLNEQKDFNIDSIISKFS